MRAQEADPAGSAPSRCNRVNGLAALLSLVRFGIDPLSEMERTYSRLGALTEFRFDLAGVRKSRPYMLAVGSRYNQRVMSDPSTFQSIGVMMPGPRGSAQRRIGNGLLGPSGASHSHYRRLLAPPLRRAAVDQMANKIGDIVDREIDAWPQGAPIDLFQACKSVTLLAALETLFPAEHGGCGDEVLAAATLFDEHIEMEAAPLVRALPLNLPGFPYHRVIRHSEKLEAALVAWTQKEGTPARADNLMSILANCVDESGTPAGDRATLNHLPTLFAAAFETSQAALTWVLFLLAQHPDAAAALLEEISALPDDSSERLVESKGLDAVTRESLRLLPIVPMLTRRTIRDTDLVDCDVAAGTYVVLSPFLTNRAPALYPEPARFLPERWASIEPTQFEYLAFGAGPRTCIGSWFASSFLRIAVGRIMRRFRLQVAPLASIDRRVRLTLKPGPGGVPVTIHPQDGRFSASPIRGNILQLVEGVG